MIAVIKERGARIRVMQQNDVPAIAEIEESTYAFPWTATIFRDCLLAGYTSLVLETSDEVIGYAVMSIAAAEAHVLNLCIEERVRRCGYANMMLDQLLTDAQSAGAERVYLEVRPTNTAALSLYRNAGFSDLGIRRDYYRATHGREDALVLVRRLIDVSD